jgi:predicted signal transduction protein with EAL and GGDEF domain
VRLGRSLQHDFQSESPQHGDRYALFAQKMSQPAVLKPTLESQLRDAIDNEEFVLHYQPKVSIVSGKLSWHPKRLEVLLIRGAASPRGLVTQFDGSK